MKTRKGKAIKRKIKLLSIDLARKEEKKTTPFFNGYVPNFFFKNDKEITNALLRQEEKELRLRKVSGYKIEELTELFLSGAIVINTDRFPTLFSEFNKL